MKNLVWFFVALFAAESVSAEVNTEIKLALEEPAVGGFYSGVSNLRGWAVAPTGVTSVEVYIDGIYAFDVPMGGTRTDVGDAFPTYPNSDGSGYSMAFNYKALGPGTHTLTVRAYDGKGDFNEASNAFTSARFVSNFFHDRNEVDLSTANGVSLVDNQTFLLEGMTVEGRRWNVYFSWDTATQSMEVVRLDPFEFLDGQCEEVGGVWSGLMSGSEEVRGGPYYLSEPYTVTRSFLVQQEGCTVTIQVNKPNYLPMTAELVGSEVYISGQPVPTPVFEAAFEEFLSSQGIVGSATATSIALNGYVDFAGGRMDIDAKIHASGYVETSQGTIAFTYEDDFSGSLQR